MTLMLPIYGSNAAIVNSEIKYFWQIVYFIASYSTLEMRLSTYKAYSMQLTVPFWGLIWLAIVIVKSNAYWPTFFSQLCCATQCILSIYILAKFSLPPPFCCKSLTQQWEKVWRRLSAHLQPFFRLLVRMFTIFDKKYRILTCRDKRESYLVLL